MAKLIKWLFISIAVMAVVVVAGGMLISPNFTVKRSTIINAPADKIYPLIADPREWKKWSAWNLRDPAMEITYSGPPSGAGAKWAWKSKSEGDGEMTFTRTEIGRSLEYSLQFPDMDAPSTGSLVMTPQGNTTELAWTMQGNMGSNPVLRWLRFMMDDWIGQDFAAGLANLKALAEKP
jgi:uncharacterized protein YndB with AHSA1/START domain